MLVEEKTKDELVNVTSYEYGLNNRLEKEARKREELTEGQSKTKVCYWDGTDIVAEQADGGIIFFQHRFTSYNVSLFIISVRFLIGKILLALHPVLLLIFYNSF